MGGGRGGGRKPYRNVDVEAETVFDAIRKLSMETPRRLFFAHNQVIVLSEKLAREKGIPPLLDFFDRNPQIRRDTWVVVARGNVKEIMDVPSQLEVTPAQRIMGIINNRELSSQFAITRLGDFIEMTEDPGVEPFTAIIEMIPNTAVSHVAFHPGGPGPEPPYDIKLTGTAVFRRDKLAGWLDEREARGLM
ncbi:Ger(x)C family spore germination protein, partial [Desulfofundulus thermobenzoicus]|nr:Ger(x)C family spore germination protein [Desulfofundulus thermobenzoicus]